MLKYNIKDKDAGKIDWLPAAAEYMSSVELLKWT